jgi:hypothetical protein
MTLDLSHLTTATKEQALQDTPTRIRAVQTARWVGFARAQLALEEMERRFKFPSCARMPCMLLYGDSGMQMPPSPDERRFYTRLLEILGAPYTSHPGPE